MRGRSAHVSIFLLDFPIARQDWYPNSVYGAFGEYATYDLTFRIPKGMKMAATGALVSDTNEGNQNVTAWKSEAPQTVAGFSFGRFKVEEAKLTKPPITIQSFANENPPGWVESLKHDVNGDLPGQQANPLVQLGSMNTTGLIKKALAESELAVQLYNDYFGPSQFTQIRITQQTACNFGQSCPSAITSTTLCAINWASIGATVAIARSSRHTKSPTNGRATRWASVPAAING
jgi:hypothetical protein